MVLVMLSGCPKRVAPVTAAPNSVRLLAAALERETTALTESRPDLEIDTRDFDRTPKVVATGETSLLTCEGASLRLFGDAQATQGFFVDNAIFLEVVAPDGKVLRSVVIGSSDPVSQGNETIDNLGRRAFTFEPGELDLTSLVPEHGAFRLRATVLDYFGVGRVSDVFVRIEPAAAARDELRDQ